MSYRFGKTIVIALGGSIVYPDGIDVSYLEKFKKFAERFLHHGHKIVLIVGGGKLAREFQNAAHKVSPLANEDKDWIGIHSTRLNAHLLRTIFRKVADPVVLDQRHKRKALKYPITIASGWRPGWSTDFVAAAIAADVGAKEFVVAGKPAYVYQKDPGLHKNAKPLRELNWKEYRSMIPKKWVPGSHAPVDPVAARFAHARKLNAIIVDGRNLRNFARLLGGNEFQGTVIE